MSCNEIYLCPAPHATDALGSRDDWSGVSDPKARRKLQNRLNQRARRRRKDPDGWTPLRSRIEDVQRGHQTLKDTRPSKMALVGIGAAKPTLPVSSHPEASSEDPFALATLCHTSCTADLPGSSHFPLSNDHLLPLIQNNVYRGILINMVILRHPDIYSCAVATSHLLTISALPMPTSIPPSLAPTHLQQTVPHPPWMDVFPAPCVRDALILAKGKFNADELCDDMLGELEGNSAEKEQMGLILWGDPWDVKSWEMTAGFAHKWGWMFRGCWDEIVNATNHWRQTRDDKPLMLKDRAMKED